MQTFQQLQTRQKYLQAHPDDEKFPGELEAFNNTLGWVMSFANKLTSGGPTDVVHSLVQLGIEDPHHTDYFSDLDCGEPLNSWFKMYQSQYNTAIWEIIMNQQGLFQKLRRVLLTDLKVTTSNSGQECGKIVNKDYAQALLDYFLQSKDAAWCLLTKTPDVLEKLKPALKLLV